MKIGQTLKGLLLLITIYFSTLSSFAQCEVSAQVLWGLPDGRYLTSNDAAFTSQKDLVVCGQVNNDIGLIVFYNGTSSVRWAKTFSLQGFVNFSKIIFLSGGDILVAGYASQNNISALLLVRIDINGTVIWTKRFQDNVSVPGLTYQYPLINDIAETANGSITIVGRKIYKRPDGNTNNRIFIFQVDGAGTVTWKREDTQGNDDEAFGIVDDQGEIVVVGTTYSTVTGIRYGFFEKLNATSGTVILLRRYQLSDLTSNFFRSIEKRPGGYELGTQAFAFGLRIYKRLLLNNNGDQIDCKILPEMGPSLIDQYYYPVPMPDGSSLIWRSQYYSSNDIVLSKITNNNIINWNYQYSHAGRQTINKLLPLGNSAALAVGYSPDPQQINGKTYIYLLKTTTAGTTEDCVNDPMPLTIKDSLNYTITQGSWQSTALNFIAPFDIQLNMTDVTLNKLLLCEKNGCEVSNIKITGDTIICKPGSKIEYKGIIEGSCDLPIQWTLSSSIGNLQVINDSMVSIQYTQSGSAILKATIVTACTTYTKQTTISYRPSTQTLNLGADRSLCFGDSLTLSVNNPFPIIQWENGITANNIKVKAPGKYSVMVSEDGTCFQKDTVEILSYPKSIVNLDKDPVLCLPGSRQLNAGSGFTEYLWQDGSTNSDFFVVMQGKYWVQVKDINGCKTSDTTIISTTSRKPADLFLFKDTAICFGEKIQLRLNGNYKQYSWQNGESTAASYIAQKPGIVTVKVSNQDGCSGTESIFINQKKCYKALYVPSAFTPNEDGKNDVLKVVTFAPLDYLDFKVYNRWGELVFQTTDIVAGWNGKYKSILQPADTFVWQVVYRFIGTNKILMQKGTVNLIK